MKDRRLHPRLDCKRPVILRGGGRLSPALILDLSEGGVSLLAEGRPLTVGDKIELIFDLIPTLSDVSIRGQIVRLQEGYPRRFGIQFTNTYSKGHQKICAFLASALDENTN